MPVQPLEDVNPFSTERLGVLRLVTRDENSTSVRPSACPVLFGLPPQPADSPEKPQEPTE